MQDMKFAVYCHDHWSSGSDIDLGGANPSVPASLSSIVRLGVVKEYAALFYTFISQFRVFLVSDQL